MKSTKQYIVTLFISSVVVASQFGSNGSNGFDGRNGYDGRDGQNITVTANGQTESFDLTGTSATDGQRGESGQNALGCVQPQNVSYDLYGANGGAGGSGGKGGGGGSGGDITVYYSELSNLKYINLRSAPGRGGYGGNGAYGGQACYCSLPQWTVINGTSTSTYNCSQGQNGSNGGRGTNGNNGTYGDIVVINSQSILPKETTTLTVPFEQLLSAKFSLRKHKWETRQGARLLFANGSDIKDSYTFFAGAVNKNIQFSWAEPRPITDFNGKSVYLSLSGEEVQVEASSGIWSVGQFVPSNDDSLQYKFEHVIFSKDAIQVAVNKPVGVGTQTELPFIDDANLSAVVGSLVKMRFYTYYNGYYYQRWSGTVPPEALVVSNSELRVQLGKLGMDEKYLAIGMPIMVQTWVTRSLGNKNYTIQESHTYKIGN